MYLNTPNNAATLLGIKEHRHYSDNCSYLFDLSIINTKFALREGLEPTTYGLTVRRSNQLSYRRIMTVTKQHHGQQRQRTIWQGLVLC